MAIAAAASAQPWTGLTNLQHSRFRHVAATGELSTGESRVFVFGGVVFGLKFKAVDAYDPVGMSWDPPSTYPDMPISRTRPSVATAGDGKIYVIGGIGPNLMDLASVDVFDPSVALNGNPWSTIKNMPTARNSAGAAFGSDGNLYVIGGRNASGGQSYDLVERYDPVTKKWDTMTALPMPLPGPGGVTVGAAQGCDGEIVAISTSWPGGGPCSGHTFAYDLANDMWNSRASMPGCLDGGGVVGASNGKIYAVNDGDYYASSPGDTRVYSYHSRLDAWTMESNTIVGHNQLAAAALGAEIYALGGTSKFGANPGSRFESLTTGVTSSCHTWERRPSTARDVGAGADGTTWKIGTDPRIGGYDISRWVPGNNNWVGVHGGGMRIDVDPQGDPWVVNDIGDIYRWQSPNWQVIGDKATDIGIGANGDVWKIGIMPVVGGFDISRWDGLNWIRISGGAVRIDVDAQGNPWVVNDIGRIYKYTKLLGTWEPLPDLATDIGVGANNAVWKTGTHPPSDIYGFKISRWDGTSSWEAPVSGAAEEISVGPDGTPWVVNLLGGIYHRH